MVADRATASAAAAATATPVLVRVAAMLCRLVVPLLPLPPPPPLPLLPPLPPPLNLPLSRIIRVVSKPAPPNRGLLANLVVSRLAPVLSPPQMKMAHTHRGKLKVNSVVV